MPMPEAELWNRLNRALGPDYAPMWAHTVAVTELGSRTVVEALADGMACVDVWRAAWAFLELPAHEW